MTTREFQQKKPLSILFTYFKPHRGLFILDLVCATVVALIDLAFPLVTRKSMYDLLPNQQYRTFFIVMGVMMAAFIVRALLYYVISYWGHTFGILVEADIRRDLFTHVQELDVSFFDHNRTGQLMSRLTSDLFEITELAHHGPEDLLISTLTILGAIGIMESFSISTMIICADQILKAADVESIELRLGNGLGGKSYFTFTGDVSAVQAGSSAGVAIAKEKGLLVNSEVIPSPSHRLIESLL